MDVSRRNRLVEKLKVKQTQVGQNPGPTVSLEDFFEGNDDLGSIGCNLSAHPGVGGFCGIPNNGQAQVIAWKGLSKRKA